MPVNDGTILISNQDLPKVSGYYDRNILFVGIKNDSGSANDFELKKNILSKEQVASFYAKNSHIAQGLNYAVKFANNFNFGDNQLKINAVGIEDAGTQATANLTLSGTALETITTLVYCGNSKAPKKLTISKGDTSVNVITKLKALFDTDLELFFSSAIDGSNTSKLNLTASVSGTWANYVLINILNLPSGITISSLNQFSGGTYSITSLTNLKTAILKEKFDLIVIEKDIFDIDSSLVEFFEDRNLIVRNKNLVGDVLFADVNNTAGSIVNDLKQKQFGRGLALKKSYTLPYLTLSDLSVMMEGILVKDFKTNQISIATISGGVYQANAPISNLRSNVIDELFDEEVFTDDEYISLNQKGFLTLERNDNNLAIFTGNKSMYILDANGDENSLSRITDQVKKQIIVKEFFEVIKTFKNKSLVDQKTENNIYHITKEEIESSLLNVVDLLAGYKEADKSGIVEKIDYKIVQDFPNVIKTMKDVIRNKVARLVPARSIDLDALAIYNIIIENVGMNLYHTN